MNKSDLERRVRELEWELRIRDPYEPMVHFAPLDPGAPDPYEPMKHFQD